MEEPKHPSTEMAKILFAQIDQTDADCGQWMFSAVSKLLHDSPDMTVRDLRKVMEETMPESEERYLDWLINT